MHELVLDDECGGSDDLLLPLVFDDHDVIDALPTLCVSERGSERGEGRWIQDLFISSKRVLKSCSVRPSTSVSSDSSAA